MKTLCKTPLLFFSLVILLVMIVIQPSTTEAQSFVFNLTGGQEVPRVFTQASGTCSAILREDQDGGEDVLEFIISCEHNVKNPTAAHIHRGIAGQNGPVLYTFEDPEELQALLDVSFDDLAELLTEGWYVNVHSTARPNGELRGQIRFQAVNVQHALFFPLGGDQVVPPVVTQADGRCIATLHAEGAMGEIFLLCHHTVSDPIAAHIHQGQAGENGPIVVDLGTGESPILLEDEGVTSALVDAFLAGNLYVQVHSTGHPAGEIRGQITGCVEGRNALCLNRGRFQVKVTWREFQGNTGEGQAIRQGADSGAFWFFDPDNTELQIKILNACADPFNHYWVFFSGTTNVQFTVTVTDSLSGEVKVYNNALGHPADPVLDTQAFATCP